MNSQNKSREELEDESRKLFYDVQRAAEAYGEFAKQNLQCNLDDQLTGINRYLWKARDKVDGGLLRRFGLGVRN